MPRKHLCMDADRGVFRRQSESFSPGLYSQIEREDGCMSVFRYSLLQHFKHLRVVLLNGIQ